jgi:transposase
MRFVPVKSSTQHDILCVHRLREGLKEESTSCIKPELAP